MKQRVPARQTASTQSHPLPAYRSRTGIAAIVLWVMVMAALPVVCHFDLPAWDAKIYLTAVQSVRQGHDPWADGIAVQNQAHLHKPHNPTPDGPFSYVYSPITLPVLKLAGALPLWLLTLTYFLLYIAGVIAELWFGMQAVRSAGDDPAERKLITIFLPLAIFFPGFLGCDTFISGNIVFLFYGAILVAAVYAWRRQQWLWFYLAVLLASCFKLPLLTLLAIPIFSARRQWLGAGVTAIAGVALFAIQPILWPSYFRHYLEAVELQFSYNRDFGFSPAGLVSAVLYDHNLPYSPACSIFYLLYAIPVFAILWSLSRRYLRGDFTLQDWAPVLLAGVILLNPRLMEYDAAPLAVPMALIAWRFFRIFAAPRTAAALFAMSFAGCTAFLLTGWWIWKPTEGPLLVAFFAAGIYSLLHPRRNPARQPQPDAEAMLLRA